MSDRRIATGALLVLFSLTACTSQELRDLKLATDILNSGTQDTTLADAVEVTSVVDGDTLKVNLNGKTETVRLIGIDTPETVHPTKPVECYGPEASNETKKLKGQMIVLEYDSSQGQRDKYERLLAYVHTKDVICANCIQTDNFNEYLIRNGFADEYTYQISNPYKHQSSFINAMIDARDNNRGMWGACT